MRTQAILIVVFASICVAEALADEAQKRHGELALVEIVSWGTHTCEPGDAYETGFLHAKTIETKGEALPPTFKLSFMRGASSTSNATCWNNFPGREGGGLGIRNGEWIIGEFIRAGDAWEAVCGEREFALSRPEDMAADRLQRVQAHFTTQLVRVWVPVGDLLADILKRVRWRMSVADFSRAYTNLPLVEGGWQLTRDSYRKTIKFGAPNTEVRFEFSGVVDNRSTNVEPLSSSLVQFQIRHPLVAHPDAAFLRPQQNRHYHYLSELARHYQGDLDRDGVKYDLKTYRIQEYVSQESVAHDKGSVTFVFWSNTSDEGVVAKAPPALIADDIEKERKAADEATRDWPLHRCGSRTE